MARGSLAERVSEYRANDDTEKKSKRQVGRAYKSPKTPRSAPRTPRSPRNNEDLTSKKQRRKAVQNEAGPSNAANSKGLKRKNSATMEDLLVGCHVFFRACAEGDVPRVKLLLGVGRKMSSRKGANDGFTALHFAAMCRKPECVTLLQMLSAEIDLEEMNRFRQTPLHIACKFDNLIGLKWLIKEGANLHHRDVAGRTVLHHAAGSKTTGHRTSVLEYLLKLPEASKYVTDRCEVGSLKPSSTPIHLCGHNIRAAAILVKAEPSLVTCYDEKNRSWLHWAAQKLKTIDGVKKLVDKGFDVTVTDKDGLKAEDIAFNEGHFDMHKLLRTYKPLVVPKKRHFSVYFFEWDWKLPVCGRRKALDSNSVKNVTKEEEVAQTVFELHRQIKLNKLDTVLKMIENGIDLNHPIGDKNQTAVHAVCDVVGAPPETVKILQKMIKKKADVNARTITRQNPMHLATVRNNYGCVRLLREGGTDLLARTGKGYTILHTAAQYSEGDILWYLLDNSEKIRTLVNDKCQATHSSVMAVKSRVTPLHLACKYKNLGGAEALIHYGADIFHKDADDALPIHYAMEAGHGAVAIIEMLLELGFDNKMYQVADGLGKSLSDYAKQKIDEAEQEELLALVTDSRWHHKPNIARDTPQNLSKADLLKLQRRSGGLHRNEQGIVVAQ